jgi:hypothetical protein
VLAERKLAVTVPAYRQRLQCIFHETVQNVHEMCNELAGVAISGGAELPRLSERNFDANA